MLDGQVSQNLTKYMQLREWETELRELRSLSNRMYSHDFNALIVQVIFILQCLLSSSTSNLVTPFINQLLLLGMPWTRRTFSDKRQEVVKPGDEA